jgi:hypothetical protein
MHERRPPQWHPTRDHEERLRDLELWRAGLVPLLDRLERSVNRLAALGQKEELAQAVSEHLFSRGLKLAAALAGLLAAGGGLVSILHSAGVV